ncbi:MAG: DEAD/DEAH box helicase [Candidatus Competibacteraceae bacterium]
MFALKHYQEDALNALDNFLQRVRVVELERAWRECAPLVPQKNGKLIQLPYQKDAFGDIPCVCLRLPTGGGKTLLAAHAVARVGKTFCDTDAPVVLWLTPSDTIRSQTVAALNQAGHPYRQALEQKPHQVVRVLELDQLATVNPYEIGRQTLVLVATIQAFRVQDEKKAQRTVYAYDEALEPHFQGLTPQQTADLDKVELDHLESQPHLTTANLGQVKASLANFLHLMNPIVIVDEAHNNRTETSFTTLKRLNPACVIELTATPVGNSNVLYTVSAQALKTEDMIKLPIVLAEHPTGWRDAVRDAILTRQRLETLAQREPDYIRPVLLFQAEAKNKEVTVEVLLAHLISPDGAGLDQNEIAVATGTEKGLDGIDLFDRACRIRYVITVEALKEGWDCSFAYVLCSLQESRSAKDVEQLLGRVLRMPYARARITTELNHAYAHVLAASFSEAANRLTDRLVNNMGFEKYEAEQAVTPSASLFPEDAATGTRPLLPDCVLSVPAAPPLPVPAELQAVIEVRQTHNGATVIVHGEVSEAVENYT